MFLQYDSISEGKHEKYKEMYPDCKRKHEEFVKICIPLQKSVKCSCVTTKSDDNLTSERQAMTLE